jgi:FMN phosphatase YigB (HAD superfamily)
MAEITSSVKVISFDVFDTVITRNVYRPSDLFLRIQTRLAGCPQNPSSISNDFHKKRMEAEYEARKRYAGSEEVTLEQIWAVYAESSALSSDDITFMVQEEIKDEVKSISPIAVTSSFIKQMRVAGFSIVFLSDMYLPNGVIRDMLEKVGVIEPNDRLYLSGEIGLKKSTGNLFKFLKQDLGLASSEMVHIGDFMWGDVIMPRWKHGIHSVPLRIARANSYERLWGEPCRCLYCSSVAGASRAARVAQAGEGRSSFETTLYDLGCNVLGPILVGFILWILQQAEKTGIRRLYFLSRDGEIMLEFARELAGRLGIDIELRYLYVSRTAVFPALMGTGVNSKTIEWVKEDTIILTIRILADRLKVDCACMQERLIRAGLSLEGPDALLDNFTVDKICSLLVTDPVLKEMLAVSGRKSNQNLYGYLEKEGLFDGVTSALVDLGWHGGIQNIIYSCYGEQLGANGISGYYFGVDLAGEPANRKFGYFFSKSENTEIQRYRHLFRVLLELMCTGSHGMVLGYCTNSRGINMPEFGQPEHHENFERIAHLRQGAATFLKHLDSASLAGVDFEHVKPQILDVLKRLFFYPTIEEAFALGDMRFSSDQAGHGVRNAASPFGIVSAIRFLFKKSYAERSTISSWFFASWVRSRWRVRLLLSPLVLVVRVCYGGTDVLKFSRMKIIDLINKSSCISYRLWNKSCR